MHANRDGGDLGGWTSLELRSTLAESLGVGSDHDLEAVIRFLRGVATVVRRRRAIDVANTDPKTFSVFLLSPHDRVDEDMQREPMLDSGQTQIAGKIWFVNAPVISGRAKELTAEDADAVFRTVTEDLALGSVPAAVVDPRPPKVEVRFYATGLENPDDYVPVRLHSSDIDLQQVCEIIERVYRQCLITPDAQPEGNKLWKDPRKHRPHRKAEHKVQAFLKPAFAAAFPTCRVYDEFAGTLGRADLHLEEPDPVDRAVVTFLAVLELKVLRSYSNQGSSYSPSEIHKSLENGVKQAGAYRAERGHRVAAVCCFDMRHHDDEEECFKNVRHLADNMQVALRRWYLYASAKLYREN